MSAVFPPRSLNVQVGPVRLGRGPSGWEAICLATRAGKHVLCDKPLAITVDDAERAVEACAEADVRLGVNFHYRYLPWVRDTARLVADGTIGTIEVAQVEVGSGPRDHHGWKADRELAGLGALYNVGVHALDALGVILGAEPVEVTAMVDAATDGLERIALVLLRFDNGTLASVRCDERVKHPLNDLVLHGSTGRVIARGLTRSLVDGQLEVLTERRRTTTGYPSPGAHRLCLAAFTDAVLAGRDPVPSGADGVRSVRLCAAINRSARERRNVDV